MPALAFGIPLSFDKAHVEGITKIEAIDIRYAEEMGYRIKLLGIAAPPRNSGACGRFRAARPSTLIPSNDPVANVEGVMNAVLVGRCRRRHALLRRRACGRGTTTASAVIADLVDDVTRHVDRRREIACPRVFQRMPSADRCCRPRSESSVTCILRV